MLGLLALNPLNTTDKIFFIVLAAIILVCVGVYFLIPVFNKKQYKEMRDNLKKREAAFRSNVQRTDGAAVTAVPQTEPAAQDPALPDGAPAETTEDEEK